MSLESKGTPQAAYIAHGSSALEKGCLIITAIGDEYCSPPGSPANLPTTMSVVSLAQTLTHQISRIVVRSRLQYLG